MRLKINAIGKYYVHHGRNRTNKSIAEELRVASGTLLNSIEKQKPSCFGHIKRQQTMDKLIPHEKVEGQRNRGRPNKRSWENDLEDTRLDGGKCLGIGTNGRRLADV